MSARPRPVTATFKPDCMIPPTGVRTRSYSLSSGSSTESLISVLDHDSYESIGGSDNEEQPTGFTPKPTRPPKSRTSSTGPTRSTSSNVRRHTDDQSPNKRPVTGMSWEIWMVEKAKELRLKQKAETNKEKQRKEEERQKNEKKKAESLAGQTKIKEWVQEKNTRERLQKKQKEQQERSKQEIQEAEKQKTLEKSSAKYDEWVEQKRNKEKELRKENLEKKKKELKEKEEKEKKAQEAFDKWCQKAQKRPRSVHSSLGYTSGKLTGYYDGTANPAPSFYNPIPWIPVEIPTTKPQRKRSKSARRWNPDKYF